MERSGGSASFAELAWMSEKQRQSLKLLEPKSFDMYKNTTVLIIVMLDHSKVDKEVSDASMEAIGSDKYREISGDNRDANSILAIMQKRARFFCKDGWKFINPFI